MNCVPLNATDPSGHKEINEGDAYQEAYSQEYWYCYVNPASPGCQIDWEQVRDAAFLFVGVVSVPTLIRVAVEAHGVRLLEATVEEAVQSELTDRPFDPINVALGAGIVLDEIYTAATSARPAVKSKVGLRCQRYTVKLVAAIGSAT